MTLENLFARAAQEQAFLLLLLCGLALGLMYQVLGWARHALPVLTTLWDVVFAAVTALALLGAMLYSGGGVRLYSLLGLTVGVTLYHAGIRWLLAGIMRLLRRLIGRKTPKQQGEQKGDVA